MTEQALKEFLLDVSSISEDLPKQDLCKHRPYPSIPVIHIGCLQSFACIVKYCKSTMYKSPSKVRQASLFWDLEVMLSPKNSLYKLANLIEWDAFEQSFAPLYSKDNGRMTNPSV